MLGSPVLLLGTQGRKSGKRRTTPLLYLRDGDNMVVVASNGGTSSQPAWWLNLQASPEAAAQVGGRRLHVRAEAVGGEERRRLWGRLVQMYGPYEGYQRKTDREIPVVVLRPVVGSGPGSKPRRKESLMADVPTITREELKEKMDRGDDFVLLEVLGEGAYRQGHLPGAIRFQDPKAAPEVLPDKGKEIVAYCSNFN